MVTTWGSGFAPPNTFVNERAGTGANVCALRGIIDRIKYVNIVRKEKQTERVLFRERGTALHLRLMQFE